MSDTEARGGVADAEEALRQAITAYMDATDPDNDKTMMTLSGIVIVEALIEGYPHTVLLRRPFGPTAPWTIKGWLKDTLDAYAQPSVVVVEGDDE